MIDDETRARIKNLYNTGNSIQAIARHERLEVPQVISIIGLHDLTNVEYVGDQVDQETAGQVPLNHGHTEPVPYTTD